MLTEYILVNGQEYCWRCVKGGIANLMEENFLLTGPYAVFLKATGHVPHSYIRKVSISKMQTFQ